MNRRETGPRHRAARERGSMIGGMLTSASIVGGACVVAALAAGGTYALWNGEHPISSATIESGTLGLTVNGAASTVVDGTAWSKLLPGDIVSQQVTLKNTGNAVGTVTASTSGGFGPLEVRAKKGACGATITGTSSTVSPTTLGVFTAGESSLVCLQVTMPASAPANAQGSSQSFTVSFLNTAGS